MLKVFPRQSIVSFILSLSIAGTLMAQSQTQEIPNFSILFQGNMGQVSGFLGNSTPTPGGGLWLGIGVDKQWDGLWGMDFYSMPNQAVTVTLNPSKSNPATVLLVQPTDDFTLTVNTRWYCWNKFDDRHQCFNTVPYLVGGIGMDFVVDEYQPPPGSNFYGNTFDILFSVNLGAGVDVPLGDGRQWFVYAEGMDHLIAWQGSTQIISARVGFKVMLDSAHVDPFRGILQ